MNEKFSDKIKLIFEIANKNRNNIISEYYQLLYYRQFAEELIELQNKQYDFEDRLNEATEHNEEDYNIDREQEEDLLINNYNIINEENEYTEKVERAIEKSFPELNSDILDVYIYLMEINDIELRKKSFEYFVALLDEETTDKKLSNLSLLISELLPVEQENDNPRIEELKEVLFKKERLIDILQDLISIARYRGKVRLLFFRRK